jgi:hypothetical protein
MMASTNVHLYVQYAVSRFFCANKNVSHGKPNKNVSHGKRLRFTHVYCTHMHIIHVCARPPAYLEACSLPPSSSLPPSPPLLDASYQ